MELPATLQLEKLSLGDAKHPYVAFLCAHCEIELIFIGPTALLLSLVLPLFPILVSLPPSTPCLPNSSRTSSNHFLSIPTIPAPLLSLSSVSSITTFSKSLVLSCITTSTSTSSKITIHPGPHSVSSSARFSTSTIVRSWSTSFASRWTRPHISR